MINNFHGIVSQTHKNATATYVKELDCFGFNSVIIWHEMSGVTTGGYVQLEEHYSQLGDGNTNGLMHPAPAGNSEYGSNVKTAATATGYVTIVKGVSRYVGVKLTVTDGTHNVHVQPVNL